MTDRDLFDLMEQLGERTPVGPPPSFEAPQRRPGILVGLAAAAAVAATIGGVALVADRDGTTRDGGRPASYVPTPGTRLVGIGHLAVEVPDAWGTNETRCGTPLSDTVVIDQGAICLAGVPRDVDVESVELLPGWWGGAGERGEVATDDVLVAGQPAERVATRCTDRKFTTTSEQPQCRAMLYFPEQDVSVLADSSSADARAQVEEILARVVWVEDRTAVPGSEWANIERQDDDAGEHYRRQLEGLGFVTETVTRSMPGHKPGYVLGVSPRPGTMLEPGATVTVTEVAEHADPGERVAVSLNSVGPGDSMDYRALEDAEIRSGQGRVVVPLGGEVWVLGLAEESVGRVAGEVEGEALALDPRTTGPNVGRTWDAVAVGTARLTVVVHVDGRRYDVGTVTVVVR